MPLLRQSQPRGCQRAIAQCLQLTGRNAAPAATAGILRNANSCACPTCGAIAAETWTLRRHEAMAQMYQRLFRLKPVGPHRPMLERVLRQRIRTYTNCGTSGFRAGIMRIRASATNVTRLALAGTRHRMWLTRLARPYSPCTPTRVPRQHLARSVAAIRTTRGSHGSRQANLWSPTRPVATALARRHEYSQRCRSCRRLSMRRVW